MNTNRFFKRTDDYILLTVLDSQHKLEVFYGIEGNAGVQTKQTDKDAFYYPSAPELEVARNKLIATILNDGYVETKPQELFPNTIEDFYDEPVIETAIENLKEHKECEHFSLITWNDPAEDGLDDLLTYFIENKKEYQHIEHFTFGNMDYEICEMSWIVQSDYSEFFKAFPSIKSFSAQGVLSNPLQKMDLPQLEILELWSSGLSKETLTTISQSNLPNLKKLNLLVGVEDYGCDVNSLDIKNVLANTNFTNLINLGICNISPDNFGEILEAIIESKYASQLKVLDLSKSVSMDKDATYLLEHIDKLKNIKYIDLHYNFFTPTMIKKLQKCPITINVSENEKPEYDDDDNQLYSAPLYTE